MSISIALATWNGAPYLRQQLQSFLEQTRQPDEVVISDDASSDATLQVADSVLAEARFRVIIKANKQRLGVGANFSRALSHCRGDIVCLSDQDDVWFPEKLERIEEEFQRRPHQAVLVSDAVIGDADLTTTGQTRIEQVRGGLYSLDHHVQGSCTSIRRSLLQHMLPVPAHLWTHDSWIHAVAQLLDVRGVLREPLQFFRRHGNNESDSPTSSIIPLTTGRALAGKFRRIVLYPPSRQATIAEQLARGQCLLAWWERQSEGLVRLPYVEREVARTNAQLIHKKIDVSQKRIQAVQRSRVRRIPSLVAIYAQGGVDPMGGKTELIKDLIIR